MLTRVTCASYTTLTCRHKPPAFILHRLAFSAFRLLHASCPAAYSLAAYILSHIPVVRAGSPEGGHHLPSCPPSHYLLPCFHLICHCVCLYCSFCLVANPGQYSEAFVSEFKIFMTELRDFFNAAGLTQLLDATKSAMGAEDQQAWATFLHIPHLSLCPSTNAFKVL
jgi:hypothetical protein